MISHTDGDPSAAVHGSKDGLVLRNPRHYDLIVWFATFGRESDFRDKVLDLADPQPGERVLDVGCGTGSLAIRACRRVGPSGEVRGVDASAEMVAAARRKSKRAGTPVTFERAAAQALPFEADRFDAVLSTIMLHHLPREARTASCSEMARVLRPGGRVLIVDFARSAQQQKGPLAHIHRHGRVPPDELRGLVEGAGLAVARTGPVGFRDTHYVLAVRP
jgi:ubiquinone/menaquinone biosynthesis C-methylase UbiE